MFAEVLQGLGGIGGVEVELLGGEVDDFCGGEFAGAAGEDGFGGGVEGDEFAGVGVVEEAAFVEGFEEEALADEGSGRGEGVGHGLRRRR